MITETIPQYEHVTPSERGARFNISFDTYRMLCQTMVPIMNSLPVETGL